MSESTRNLGKSLIENMSLSGEDARDMIEAMIIAVADKETSEQQEDESIAGRVWRQLALGANICDDIATRLRDDMPERYRNG